MAAGGAVITIACAPSPDVGHQPYAGLSSWEVLSANNASTAAYVHGATMSILTCGETVFDETFFETVARVVLHR